MSSACCICNGVSDGFHFGVLACRACSSFFRRSLAENKKYTCRAKNQCNVTENYRNICRACRLRKCVEMGMKRTEAAELPEDSARTLQPPPPATTAVSAMMSCGETSASFPATTTSVKSVPAYLRSHEATTGHILRELLNFWRAYISSMKSVHTVEDPSSIFAAVQYKMITKTQYDKVEKASMSILFSLLIEHFPPFKRLSHEQRIGILKSTTARCISMLFKSYLTACVFPDTEDKLVMAYGFYVVKSRLDYFFENKEGHQSAISVVLPIFEQLVKMSKRTAEYREVDVAASVALFVAHEMRFQNVSEAEDELFWHSLISEWHMDLIKTHGLLDGGIRFGEYLLNIGTLLASVQAMNESLTVVRLFLPENIADVWNIYA